jgi:uncharacterized protein YnzC (UPF0291/DUF896 family)
MLSKEKIDRINVLARKSKGEGLTPEEKKEHHHLRQEYLASFREQFRSQLDNIHFVEDLDEGNAKN